MRKHAIPDIATVSEQRAATLREVETEARRRAYLILKSFREEGPHITQADAPFRALNELADWCAARREGR